MDRLYAIVSKNFDGRVRKSWTGRLIDRADPLLVFDGEFDRDVVHSHLGTISQGTVSIEYFWFDRWYNIFKFHEPDGAFRNFYCNIAMPPTLHEASLEFVDLDIDLLVDADGNISVLDEDEFRENAARFAYPVDIVASVKTAVEELTGVVHRRDFPFDHADPCNIRLHRS